MKWNVQKEKDVFFEIKGWGSYYFECIMTDGTTQYATGFCDECADGQVNTYLCFTDKDFSIDDDLDLKYKLDDILCWREIEMIESSRSKQIRMAIDSIIPVGEDGRNYEQSLIATGFEKGVNWADNNPSAKTIVKTIGILNKCGWIEEHIQADPEHFVKTVVIPGWNEILEKND